MTEDALIRCWACRGTKKYAGIGGVIGDCVTCDATGKVLASTKPKIVEAVVETDVSELISAVSDCLPITESSDVIEEVAVEVVEKVDGKKSKFHHKTSK